MNNRRWLFAINGSRFPRTANGNPTIWTAQEPGKKYVTDPKGPAIDHLEWPRPYRLTIQRRRPDDATTRVVLPEDGIDDHDGLPRGRFVPRERGRRAGGATGGTPASVVGGSAPFKNLRVEGKRDLGDVTAGGTGELVAAVSTMKSLIELEPAKFEDYLKEEGLTDVIAWRAAHGESDGKPGKERYSKYSKSVLLAGSPNGFGRKKTGFEIEIVPEADPYLLKAGDLLPVQVLFRGKPAADMQIETDWVGKSEPSKTTVPGRTGPDGRFKVPMTAAGRWRIHTIRMERCAELAVADWESVWASLTLEVR